MLEIIIKWKEPSQFESSLVGGDREGSILNSLTPAFYAERLIWNHDLNSRQESFPLNQAGPSELDLSRWLKNLDRTFMEFSWELNQYDDSALMIIDSNCLILETFQLLVLKCIHSAFHIPWKFYFPITTEIRRFVLLMISQLPFAN